MDLFYNNMRVLLSIKEGDEFGRAYSVVNKWFPCKGILITKYANGWNTEWLCTGDVRNILVLSNHNVGNRPA